MPERWIVDHLNIDDIRDGNAFRLQSNERHPMSNKPEVNESSQMPASQTGNESVQLADHGDSIHEPPAIRADQIVFSQSRKGRYRVAFYDRRTVA